MNVYAHVPEVQATLCSEVANIEPISVEELDMVGGGQAVTNSI